MTREMVRALLVVAVLAVRVGAEPMPSGSIGLVSGAVSGTGADAKQLGFGFYQFGAQASWQPTTTEHRLGWTLRWGTLFGVLYNGSSALVDSTIRTVQMDLTLGLRYRPWKSPTRYLTLRGGGELLRTNEPITDKQQRSFVGGIASVGLDQYIGGFMFSVDVRYGLLVTGPDEVALTLGIGFAGP